MDQLRSALAVRVLVPSVPMVEPEPEPMVEPPAPEPVMEPPVPVLPVPEPVVPVVPEGEVPVVCATATKDVPAMTIAANKVFIFAKVFIKWSFR